MATMTAPSATGTTTRRVQVRSNFERYAFLFMRLTGVLLLFLAVGHMMIQHILNDVHTLTLEFVRQQWSSWGWRAYDLMLLIFGISHGFNGLRQVIADYVHSPQRMRVINWILAIVTVITILWSAVAIFTFPVD
jgi:succinate dehydrogenase / fumarate reductase, membrane anchor subunit